MMTVCRRRHDAGVNDDRFLRNTRCVCAGLGALSTGRRRTRTRRGITLFSVPMMVGGCYMGSPCLLPLWSGQWSHLRFRSSRLKLIHLRLGIPWLRKQASNTTGYIGAFLVASLRLTLVLLLRLGSISRWINPTLLLWSDRRSKRWFLLTHMVHRRLSLFFFIITVLFLLDQILLVLNIL